MNKAVIVRFKDFISGLTLSKQAQRDERNGARKGYCFVAGQSVKVCVFQVNSSFAAAKF